MKTSVYEVRMKENKPETKKFKTKKEAIRYIKQRKDEIDKKDKEFYKFFILKGWD